MFVHVQNDMTGRSAIVRKDLIRLVLGPSEGEHTIHIFLDGQQGPAVVFEYETREDAVNAHCQLIGDLIEKKKTT